MRNCRGCIPALGAEWPGGGGSPSRWTPPPPLILRRASRHRAELRQHERALQHWITARGVPSWKEGGEYLHAASLPPLILRRDSARAFPPRDGCHASAHAQGALAASATHQGRGDWTPTPTWRDGDWGRLDGRVLFVEGVGLLVGVGGVEDGGLVEVAT